MKREVVRDFLNLPGVTGIVLMDDRSRPYFLGVDQTLNTQQKEALVQGIRHVLGTIPQDFESFEFQFTGRQLYIYKLKQQLIMLVLAHGILDYNSYTKVFTNLKNSLEDDLTKGIATFRLLASEITMSGQNYQQKQTTHEVPSSTQQSASPTNIDLSFKNGRYPATPPTSLTEDITHNKRLPPDLLVKKPTEATPTIDQPSLAGTSETQSLPEVVSSPALVAQPEAIAPSAKPIIPPVTPRPNLKEFLTALNTLSYITTKYLGTAVIVNYWKSTRPNHDWLKTFDIDRSAKISLSSSVSQDMTQPISPEQLELLRKWIHSFMERCTRVIRDLPHLVDQSALTDRQKSILL